MPALRTTGMFQAAVTHALTPLVEMNALMILGGLRRRNTVPMTGDRSQLFQVLKPFPIARNRLPLKRPEFLRWWNMVPMTFQGERFLALVESAAVALEAAGVLPWFLSAMAVDVEAGAVASP